MKYHAPTPSHKLKEAQGNYWEQREEFRMWAFCDMQK